MKKMMHKKNSEEEIEETSKDWIEFLKEKSDREKRRKRNLNDGRRK